MLKETRTFTIKYNNLIKKHFMIPPGYKTKVLDICVCSTLIYGCETWRNRNIPALETTYRQGLKRALSIREGTNRNSLYRIEQLSTSRSYIKTTTLFLVNLNSYLLKNPEHPLKRLIEYGERINVNYLR